MTHHLRVAAWHYGEWTRWFELTFGKDRIAHIHAGLLIWLVAALLMRVPLRNPKPLIVVAIAEAINECIDRINHHSWRWPDTTSDVIYTLFWPTVLTIALALSRRLRG